MGTFANPTNLMKDLLANCEKFQEFVGADNATQAKEKIYTDPVHLTKDTVLDNFYAVIVNGELELELTKTGLGSGAYSSDSSTLINIIGTYEKQSPANSILFNGAIDEIVEEILMLRGTPGYKEINYFRKMRDVPYMWKLSTKISENKFEDYKRGFQVGFEEGMIVQ